MSRSGRYVCGGCTWTRRSGNIKLMKTGGIFRPGGRGIARAAGSTRKSDDGWRARLPRGAGCTLAASRGNVRTVEMGGPIMLAEDTARCAVVRGSDDLGTGRTRVGQSRSIRASAGIRLGVIVLRHSSTRLSRSKAHTRPPGGRASRSGSVRWGGRGVGPRSMVPENGDATGNRVPVG